MVREPALRDELLARADAELRAADALFARAAQDPHVGEELDRLMDDPDAPLIVVLAAWEGRPPEADGLLEVNAANGRWVAEAIGAHGWPGLRAVGADGTDAAWLLARHADRTNDVRRSAWLPLLRAAVDAGEADPRHYATLADRAAVVAGQRQLYGTIDAPLDDPEAADARRAEIGMASRADDAPHLVEGEIAPYGPERGASPVNQWPLVVEGHVSVEAALEAGVRRVHRVWATRPGDRRLGRLRALARERSVTIDAVPAEEIDRLVEGRSHGGVVALVGARRTLSVHQLLAEMGEGSLIVMLDGIEDPFNFGQAVRALYAAGVDGLVVRRHWETALATVTRASAGATELLPTATVAAPEEAADACRAAGMRVACAVADPDAVELDEADLSGGLFVLIGGERRGITRSFVAAADLRIRIGYGRERAPDLGTAAAAAVIGFAALRQRGKR